MSKPNIMVPVASAIAFLIAVAAVFVHNEHKDGRELDLTSSPPQIAAPAVTGNAPMRWPPLSARQAAEPKPPRPAEQSPSGRLDESSLMSRLRDLAASDPPQSLALAREAVARFPTSPNAPEFEWNVVKALANMERYKEAEDEARVMVERYPGSAFSDDVERHLLNHPPNPVTIADP